MSVYGGVYIAWSILIAINVASILLLYKSIMMVKDLFKTTSIAPTIYKVKKFANTLNISLILKRKDQ